MMDFCSYVEMLPDALVHMRKNDVYRVLDGYVAWMIRDKFAPNSLRNRLSAVKKFLAVNDFELDNAKMRVEVDLSPVSCGHGRQGPNTGGAEECPHAHRCAREGPGHDACLERDEGGEFLILKVKDIDLSNSPATVRLKAGVTKDRQARYCFVSDEVVTFLKDFLRERINSPDDYLFRTSTRCHEHKTGNVPMSYWNADHIFSLALKNAGLAVKDDHGRDTIHIHCLRKFFFTQMLQPLGRDIAEALMGHKLFLDSVQAIYGGSNDGVLPQGDGCRHDNAQEAGMSQDEIKESFRREIFMRVAGYSEEEVAKLDLSNIKEEDFQKMVRENLLGAIANNGHKQKVISTTDVEQYLEQGWQYVASLPDDRAILKLPH